MSTMRNFSSFLSQSKRMAGNMIGACALLAMTGPALSAEAGAKDEVLKLTTAIQIPGIAGLTSYDISYADPGLKKYVLAVRDAKAIAIVDATKNSITLSDPVFAGVAGAGPNGVWTVNNKDTGKTEIWAGDGDSTVKLLDASGKFITAVSTGGAFRADEGCFDPTDQLVVVANNDEKPWPWITFIPTSGPKARTVVKTLKFDGFNGTVMATNGIEQCQWDAKTGKIYLNIPEVNGSGSDTTPGAVVVIDPVSMSVEKVFTIPLSACTGPMGMAIGPENQILLGCSANGSNSAIINARSGAVESILTGYAGTDEVWFNVGDGHYILPFCTAACRANPPTAPEQVGVIDSNGFKKDQSVGVTSATTTAGTGGMRRLKSTAAESSTNQVYVAVAAIGGGAPTYAPTICSSAPTKVGSPTDATGCIAVFSAGE
jgi:hypothetical protein